MTSQQQERTDQDLPPLGAENSDPLPDLVPNVAWIVAPADQRVALARTEQLPPTWVDGLLRNSALDHRAPLAVGSMPQAGPGTKVRRIGHEIRVVVVVLQAVRAAIAVEIANPVGHE
eukprot:CAMPEP_0117617788 /NCGR_PEP_ID=MMETSP0784-20121206/85770_1 /TAXON_ID=39447 /ORGANISM="" /LENGTH=116 /DNA_ID=CAMNT_0005421635 /DNA_START=175 /DNA_END=526 /DNA_ORIENTATION=+